MDSLQWWYWVMVQMGEGWKQLNGGDMRVSSGGGARLSGGGDGDERWGKGGVIEDILK